MKAMVSRREFLEIAGVAGTMTLAGILLAGCGDSRTASSASTAGTSNTPSNSTSSKEDQGKSIVIFFSRTGENYGVGVIEEGNTAILAKMIADKTGADSFEIAPVEAYPEGYDACCEVAKDEQNANARPAYVGDTDISDYGIVYLGYPIWWGDLPMCVYTFLEAHDWAGKEIHPFCTHEGSGLSGTPSKIAQKCQGATVTDGLAVRGATAQNDRTAAESAIDSWLG